MAAHATGNNATKIPLSILDFGGGNGSFLQSSIDGISATLKYTISIADLEKGEERSGYTHIVQDLCKHIDRQYHETFDVVWSYNAFEHFREPWIAADNVVNFLKPGGLALINTVFAWRYHPVSKDCYRFSDDALRYLFSERNELHEVSCGYDLVNRRMNIKGGYFGDRDITPVDLMGGFRENWSVFYVGKKSM